MRRHTLLKISPRPSFPSGPEALWAGGQRGVIPPFDKGRSGGIYKGCRDNYETINNTAGPRRTGQYGMVLPNFVQSALLGKPITVYGDDLSASI